MTIDLNKILTEKLTQPLDLGGYHPKLAGQVLQVWVNPPMEMRDRRRPISSRAKEIEEETKQLHPEENPEDKAKVEALKQEAQELMVQQDTWLSELWSQDPAGTHLSPEDVTRLRIESANTDPMLYGWLVGNSLGMMLEHLGFVKKV